MFAPIEPSPKRRKLQRDTDIRAGMIAVPRPVSEVPSVTECIIEKYANPMYFGTKDTRRYDHYRIWCKINTGDMSTARERLVRILVKRFAPLVGRTIKCRCPKHGKLRIDCTRTIVAITDGVIPILPCHLIGTGRIHIGYTTTRSNEIIWNDTSPAELIGGSYDHSPCSLWDHLKAQSAPSRHIMFGLHARVGADSSVLRASQHALYEREIWRMIASFN